MKQTLKIGMVLLGALTIAMWFGISSTSKKKEILSQKNSQLETELMNQESAFNEMLTLYDQVEDRIGDILSLENIIQAQSNDRINKSNHQKIFKEINMIDDLIFRSKQDLKKLEDETRSSNLKLGVFEKRISSLQTTLTERAEIIQSLKTQLSERDESLAMMISEQDSLNQTINTQLETIDMKDLEVKQLTAQNNELNKSFLAIGTYEQLKTKGVVNKEGGFLGVFGRNIALQEEADLGSYLSIDRRNLQTLRIEASSLSLVSNHPAGSYQIIPGESESEKVLEITDPENFWKISKYLVITKKI